MAFRPFRPSASRAARFEVGDVEAIVVALKIRSVEAPRAVAAATAAHDWLASRGARHVMYKICSTFDSTDSGNIGPVGEAFRARAGAGCMLVTPAFPETGRTVYLGHLFVGSVPLNESPLKDHPLNPMRDSSLVRVLQRQSKAPVGLVALPTVAEGGAAIVRRLAELEEQGCGAAIVDAVFERDLEAIGEAAARGPVSVGASGLGLGLARAFARGRGAEAGGAALEPVGGLAAILAGSCSRATLDQIAAAEGGVPTLRLSPQTADRGQQRGGAGPRLGEGAPGRRAGAHRLQRRAGRRRRAAGAVRPRGLRPCDRGGAGRYRRRPRRARREAAHRRGRRDVRGGGRPAGRQRLSARA